MFYRSCITFGKEVGRSLEIAETVRLPDAYPEIDIQLHITCVTI